MTLAPFYPIVFNDLNTEQDANRTILQNFLSAGVKQFTFNKRANDVTSTTPITQRSMEIIPGDDWELLAFGVGVYSSSLGNVITATIETPDDVDNTYLLGEPLLRTLTSTGPTYQSSRIDLTTTSALRIWLLRGVKYRCSVSTTEAAPASGSWAEINLACRARLRER